MIQAMAFAYRAGATARELAVTHDLSLSSVKRLLRTAKARKSETTQ
jgi:DNA-binding transcriptional regulator LsrR (DeoR family)